VFGQTKKKGRKKQAFTAGPKDMKGAARGPGKKKTSGHKMGNLFGVTPKKPEPDDPPRTRAGLSQAKKGRLEKIFI
jgi:hypothetical protein